MKNKIAAKYACIVNILIPRTFYNMTKPNQHEDLVDGALLRAAEYEMRRTLQHPESYRASKRVRKEGGEEEEDFLEVGRFNYSSVKDVANGMTCFLATCDFRR